MDWIRYLRTPLDLPLGLFVVSGLVGVWASYDPAASWRKFVMIIASVVIFYAIVFLRAAPQLLETFVWLFLFASAALAIYFATQHDYATDTVKFGPIAALGQMLNRIVPQLGMHVFHPNIASGELEIALPVGVAMLLKEMREERGERRAKAKREKLKVRAGSGEERAAPVTFDFSLATLILVFALALIAFGLIMTQSRGAWLALGIVGAAALAIAYAHDAIRRYALPLGLIAALLIAISVLHLKDAFLPALESVLGAIPAGNTAVSRVELWTQAWGLVRDYIFTGSGLGVFPMVLSTYALLIDVPFLTHVHNLFLQIWLEQGVLGFVAFVWLVVAFYVGAAVDSPAGVRGVIDRQATGDSQQSKVDCLHPLMWGGVAAASVMLLHGMVDVLLYSSRGLPVMFVPMAIAVASQQSTVASTEKAEGGMQKAQSRKQIARIAAYCLVPAAFCLLILSSFILHPSSLISAWYADFGAVQQTRVELGQYRWPDRLVSKVRTNLNLEPGTLNLGSAETYLRAALALDPGNITANQRLAAIALARKDYAAARGYLQAAYASDPGNEVTGKLMAIR